MDKLIEVIEDTIKNDMTDIDFVSPAKRWATYALDTFCDDLLDKALDISKAMVAFQTELRREDERQRSI